MVRRLLALCALVVCLAPAVFAQEPAPDTQWWRNSVCYQVFVRSFFDSDGDGTGDLRGLIQKLNYINDGDPATQSDLGANCIWLLPIAQSPSYHAYDVRNYYEVERDYGSNEDFKQLMAEAHRRGIRVIVDLVLNHSSSEHPHFKAATLDPDSPFREWYLFSPTRPEERGPWGQEVWHRSPVRDEYYYGVFWGGMPDLALGSPAVQEEARRIARFWLDEMGADGFRLDAVAHFFEDAEGGRAMNHPWLRDFAAFVRQTSPHAFTIGEVWDETDALIPYYPDQLDAYFAFEVSDAILAAVQTGSRDQLLAAVQRMQSEFPAGRWAPFLRNHDQTRTLTVLDGDLNRARLAATVLLTLPGVPFLYYGEELGMTGDKPDPRLRTPMHWRRAPAAGFTTGVPWEPLQPDSLTANVEAQHAEPESLLNLHRRLIRLRLESPALTAGDFLPLTASTDHALAYLRRNGDDVVLVLMNLGAAPLTRVSLAANPGTLRPGRYRLESLLGGGSAGAPRVAADGSIRAWRPVSRLEPFEARIVRLTPN